ncbi:MAG: SpoIIE family protein phosphatase, partial [Selenomonadaceae bacterium]|nr:SpoIIE family protein phosphatase [Selenomonadaceae bacterium]
AESLAFSVEKILAHPNLYAPRHLPSPTEKRIGKDEAYFLFSPKASGGSISQEISGEMDLVANIANGMEVICEIYEGYEVNCYVASEHGYFIGVESMTADEAGRRVFTEQFLNEYDPRERTWYIAAKEAKKPLLTGIYVGNDGHVEITCAAPYYDGDDFAGVVGIDLHLDTLSQMLSDRTLGTKNISFGLSEEGDILFSTESEGILAVSADRRDLRKAGEESLARAAARMAAGEMGIAPVTMNGEEYYISYAPMSKIGWSYGMMIRKEEAMQGARGARGAIQEQSDTFAESMHDFFRNTLLQVAVLLVILLFLMYRGSEKSAARIVKPILALTEGVREIAKGNLRKKLDIRTGDELENLADAVNHMTEELNDYANNIAKAAAEKKRIATELSLARGIQEGMLPSIFPKFSQDPRFELFASMDAAKEVGGDFFDFYFLDGDRLAITVADVSGKGVPAALFMVISKTVLKNAALSKDSSMDFGRAMERTNCQLCEDNEEMMFVTIFFGVLNLKTGEFVYVNGGHNAPLIGRAGKSGTDWQYIVEEKKSHMVGVIEDAAYEEKRLILSPGDMLYLYTDGVTEAMDEDGQIYTEARLRDTLCRAGKPGVPMKDILAAIRSDIDIHAEGAEQSDDITMLGVRYLG